MKLSAKITALAAILLTIMSILGIMAIANMLNSNARAKIIAYEYTTASDYGTKILKNVAFMRIQFVQLRFSLDENNYTRGIAYRDTLLMLYNEVDVFLKDAPHVVGLREGVPKMREMLVPYIAVVDSNIRYGIANSEFTRLGIAMTELAAEMAMSANNDATLISQNGYHSSAQSSLFMFIGLIIAIVLGIVLSMIITKSIVVPISTAIHGLSSGTNQVTAASGEIASSSQVMASGASEQAAALEEISSSLNEVTSMTKQTANNVKNADALVKTADEKMSAGKESMNKMHNAVIEIQKSSNATAKILKDIDEIAFQTNLLALNAAVEAARAGESGKGFAVVAEEVRNLAQRSAESAKKTAILIEESLEKSQLGVDFVKEAVEAIDEVAVSAAKVSIIIAEITTATDEQARGISQVNQAIGNVDQITQLNASNSEELAASSEQLSSQAMSMNDLVGDLVGVINGEEAKAKRVKTNNQNNNKYVYTPNASKKPATRILHVVENTPSRNSASAEHLIPFDDDN